MAQGRKPAIQGYESRSGARIYKFVEDSSAISRDYWTAQNARPVLEELQRVGGLKDRGYGAFRALSSPPEADCCQAITAFRVSLESPQDSLVGFRQPRKGITSAVLAGTFDNSEGCLASPNRAIGKSC